MSAGAEQRKLAAIMFTDMVGYSALAQRNEALALELLEEHRRLLRPIFPEHNGREVETAGDAFLVEFVSALEAVRCAVDIQQRLSDRNRISPPERAIRLRIGIHVGDVVHKDGKLMGDAVNIAARIEPLAAAGGICVSEDVARQIRNKVDHTLVTLGPSELKNIELPVVICRVVLPWETPGSRKRESAQSERGQGKQRRLTSAVMKSIGAAALVLFAIGFGWWRVHQSGKATRNVAQSSTNSLTRSSAADQKSIAVLPFVNMSAEMENEYFSDGITEEILNALARTPGLRVAARTSAFSFKGRNETVQRIGETLKVGFVLEGSVRRAGNQLRITAQLINVADGFHLWSDTFDRKAEDVFAIQTEVAQRVQEALKVQLLAANSLDTTLVGTDNLEAYDLYLRGWYYCNHPSGVYKERAVGLFRQATENDPKFAAAYAGLAASYVLLPGYAEPAVEAIPKARAAARRALELNGGLAEAHAVLGMCAQLDWDPLLAEQEYQEALHLNPNHATSHHWYGRFLREQGRMEHAIAETRKALELDPLSPIIQRNFGEVLLAAGRYDEALFETDKTLKLSPDFLLAYRTRGRIFLAQNKIPEAIAEFEKIRARTSDTWVFGNLGYAYARAGRTNEARQILEELTDASAGASSTFTMIAAVHWGLGEPDQAFKWLESAVEKRVVDPRTMKTDPFWRELVKDPRYAALLKKFGLDK